jgi:hypothetical protein
MEIKLLFRNLINILIRFMEGKLVFMTIFILKLE